MGVLLVLSVLLMQANRASIRLLERHSWVICLHCRYPLDSLDADGTCPECGSAYNRGDIAERWRLRYGNSTLESPAPVEIIITNDTSTDAGAAIAHENPSGQPKRRDSGDSDAGLAADE